MAQVAEAPSTTPQAAPAPKRMSLSAAVLRAMSLFGGLQVMQIICSAIRIKLVALWIGPAGVGLFGIYNQAVEMISQIAHLGLRTSAVRDVAGISGKRLAVIALVVRRLGWMLGLVGALATLALAPLLSELTFNDHNHTLPFMALALVIFCGSIINSEQAVMQGMKHFKQLAKATLYGTVGGLLVSIPLFYWFRINSIVPSIIAYFSITAAASLVFRSKTPKVDAPISARQTWDTGKAILALGFFMTVSTFLDMLSNYVFLAWLNITADTDTVGYYQAGYTLFNRYIGLIFSALGIEFYPRLSQVPSSRQRTSLFVSHELGLMLTVIIPVVGVFITLSEPMVRLLYAREFLIILPLVNYGIVGTVFRCYAWCLAMTILARGDGRTFICTEGFSAVSGLILNIACYSLWGLTGLGASYVIWYALYAIVVSIVYFKRYRLTLPAGLLRFTFWSIIITAFTSFTFLCYGWPIPAIITIVSAAIAGRRLIPLLLGKK